jgi:NADH-quinone oxidoreductase subunit F
VRELIDDFGKGVIDGKAVKGVLTAGVSAPILTADKLDTKLDYDSIQAAGSMLGSASLIVLDEETCIVRAAALMEEFFRHESCGKCTPCREGTWWATRVLGRIEEGYGREQDLPLLGEMGRNILFRSFCALADGAVSPISSTLQYFEEEFAAHVREGRCPLEQTRAVQEVAS